MSDKAFQNTKNKTLATVITRVIDDSPAVTEDNCAEESIRIPGSIQQHGFLLLLDEAGNRITGASENAEEFLGLPLKLILGAPLDTVLDREILAALKGASMPENIAQLVTFLGSFQIKGELYSVVTHRIDRELVLEFERLDRLVSPELMNAVITNFVGKLGRLGSEAELCQAITKQMAELTEFNRVLLYSFDDEGNGTVLNEENDGKLPSYLDLRFPGTDIPQQARNLYVLNTVRIIPDANYAPSPLRGVSDRSLGNLDLSMSVLRSVSPIHLEYMRNMGTISSMSVSIMCEGKLWGLISCHHSEPRTVPYLVRSACDLLTKMVGTQLAAFRTAGRLTKMVDFHAVQRRMLTQMAAENNYVSAITGQMNDVMRVTDANGAALLMDGKCVTDGEAPGQADVMRLAEWLDTLPDLRIFETSHLSKELPWADEVKDVASGVIAIKISDVRQSYLMWFRPEVVRTVKWAGEPLKVNEADKTLHPRKSFDIWKEQVRGRSVPWTEMEIESAMEFRGAIQTISLKRAEEEIELSEARFQQLTHALPNLVWTADDEGHLKYVNQKWRDRGLGAEGVWFGEGRLSKEDQPRCTRLWKDAVAKGKPFETELRFVGSDRWYLVHAVPFRGADKMRAGWVGTCTDLTERRERESAVRMTEKLALTGRMTSVIAHEINNPLEAITNLLYLLNQHVEGNQIASDYIHAAENELERISGITKQTLRWSRESVQRAEQGTVGAVFEDVLRLFTGKIRNRQVTAHVGNGTDLAFFGVVGQIRQVIANLVSNAVDAVPVGGKIWLEAITVGSRTEISVRDNGAGISEEMKKQIFQPFMSTKGDLGNGLGLYISHEIVERHGGTIHIESSADKGTTVRVTLPSRKP